MTQRPTRASFSPVQRIRCCGNRLGIVSVADINDLELQLLSQLYSDVLIANPPRGRLSIADLKEWHRRWLGNVYAWAGEERSVNMSKGDFMFAASGQIPRLLEKFETDCLARWTPCDDQMEASELINAIAVTHVEFILVHPFREGNGRLARLLADVMAVQAGHPPLDYSAWELEKQRYIGAIHAGMRCEYQPMQELVAGSMGLD